jgi:hypothetical protein
MQQFSNLAQTTLGANYTAGSSTLTLASGAGTLFPSTGVFTVGIGDPPSFYLVCTGRSGDVLTVNTSGAEGTTAVNAGIGTIVAQLLTAGVLDGIKSDILGACIAGTAIFSATGGSIGGLTVSGCITGVTYTSIGIYVVALTSPPANYKVFLTPEDTTNFVILQTESQTSTGFGIIASNMYPSPGRCDPAGINLVIIP